MCTQLKCNHVQQLDSLALCLFLFTHDLMKLMQKQETDVKSLIEKLIQWGVTTSAVLGLRLLQTAVIPFLWLLFKKLKIHPPPCSGYSQY